MRDVRMTKETFDCFIFCVDRQNGYVVAILVRKKESPANEMVGMIVCHRLTVFCVLRTSCGDPRWSSCTTMLSEVTGVKG